MKLRNKKTGEIADLSEGFIKDTYNGEFIQIKPVAISNKEGYLYDSLAELNAEWEDYAPTEPLIKDEKVRKAVRAWWKTVPDVVTDKRILYKKNQDLAVGIYSIYCGTIIPELDVGRMYTIAELCGEEKE